MAKKTKEYLLDLHDRLDDPEYAADYLNAVLTDPDQDGVEQRFLVALKDVAKAKGITNVATDADFFHLVAAARPKFAATHLAHFAHESNVLFEAPESQFFQTWGKSDRTVRAKWHY